MKHIEKRNEDSQMQGARRAGTGVYFSVHEDAEHRATPQMAAAVVFLH
ncbi:MAG TPA: hypothetical protein VKC56_10115 [Gallionellaceae bacterium]|nr:hypothetical protein [Gallionellaceae bacterium]